MILQAARVSDFVTHGPNNTFARVGIVGGAIIGIIAILAAPETAVAVGVGTIVRALIGGAIEGAATGQTAGKLADGIREMAIGDCKIEKGADHVFTNMKEAAIADPKCITNHGTYVVTGAEHVFIENARASRVMDLTNCPGIIATYSPDVWIGGSVTPMSNSTDILDVIGWALDMRGILKKSGDVYGLIGSPTRVGQVKGVNSAIDLATGGTNATRATSLGLKVLKWFGIK